MSTENHIALLIDADNSPADKIDEILDELAKHGVINIRRAYGNWKSPGLRSWEAVLHQYAIQPIQQFAYTKGKNATDMAMSIDAMDLLYSQKLDGFCLASSDSDFTPLVMHLRAKGAAVYGFGAAQTPRAFVNACSRFLYFEALLELGDGITSRSDRRELQEADAAARQPAEQATQAQPTSNAKSAGGTGMAAPACANLRVPSHLLREDRPLIAMLRDAVKAMQDETGWARVSAVGTHIGNKLSFDARNYGYASLTKLMAATQAFELRDEGTARVAVRDKRAAGDEVAH